MNAPFASSRTRSRKAGAFTLLELLVVIAIIGLLAGLVGPSIVGMRKGDVMTAAVRQLQDDVAYARQRALNDHTTVYMVFLPPVTNVPAAIQNALNPQEKEQFLQGQMVSYALYVMRQAGDQPGQGIARYITPWRMLPEGVAIMPEKFASITITNVVLPVKIAFPPTTNYFSFDYGRFPYPNTDYPKVTLPFIAFNHQGGLDTSVSTFNGVATIPLARGSLLTSRTAWAPPDFKEQPPGNGITNYNVIAIEKLTGRARHLSPRIQ